MYVEEIIDALNEIITCSNERDALNLTWELRNELFTRKLDGRLDSSLEVSSVRPELERISVRWDKAEQRIGCLEVELRDKGDSLKKYCSEFEDYLESVSQTPEVETIIAKFRELGGKFIEEVK